ncbi:MAG: hypothetical protein JW856_00585 [Dehalococcoidales bacterium]|nr:hypothetical protein [Dehalococcoidales bacterium]
METIFKKTTVELLLHANDLRDEKFSRQDTRNNFVSAIKIYNKVSEEVGETSYLLAAIATCQFRLATLEGNWDRYLEAISSIKRAIALSPNNGHLYAVLADYYEFGTNDYEKAANACRKAIELCPYDAWVLNKAANLSMYPDNVVTLEETISWLERLIVLEPVEAGHHAFLASQYYEAGRFQDARKEAAISLLCPRSLESGWISKVKAILQTDSENQKQK